MIKVKLDPGAYMPEKAHPDDAGYDLRAREAKAIPPHSSAIFDTGVHIQLPPGTVGMLKSRSGLNINYGIQSEGVIDAGYTGSIAVKLYNHGPINYFVHAGDKISQLVILQLYDVGKISVVSRLDDSARGNNGFGSSGI